MARALSATALIGATLLSLLYMGCTASKPAAFAPSASSGKPLVISVHGQPPTLNPLLATGFGGLEPDYIFSFLTRIDSDGNTAPDLLREVPTERNGGIAKDGLRLVYELRPGVRWQDGRELTAGDVAFTYRAITDSRNNVSLPAPFDDVASVTPTGKYSFAVRLKRRNSQITSSFFSSAWALPIVPEHAFPDGPGSMNHAVFNGSPIGSGPYRLVQWIRGDHVTLEANPYYFKGVPAIRRLIVRFNDWQTAFNEFRSGDLDAMLNIPVNYYSTVRRLRHQTTYKNSTAGYDFLAFNMKATLTSHAAIRRAITLAIDRQFVASGATRGAVAAETAARGIFNAFYDARVRPPAYDESAARAALRREGWRGAPNETLSRNGSKLTLRLISNTDIVSQTVDIIIQEQLRAIGIDVAIKTFDAGALFDADSGPIARGDFDLFYTSFYALPAYYPAWFFTCDANRVSGNYGQFCDPVMDELYRDSLRRFDRRGLQRDYSAMQRRLVRDLPIIPLWQFTRVDVCRSTFTGCDTRQAWPVSVIERWRRTTSAPDATASTARDSPPSQAAGSGRRSGA